MVTKEISTIKTDLKIKIVCFYHWISFLNVVFIIVVRKNHVFDVLWHIKHSNWRICVRDIKNLKNRLVHSDILDTWYTGACTTHINLLADSSFVEVEMPRKKKERKIGIFDEQVNGKSCSICSWWRWLSEGCCEIHMLIQKVCCRWWVWESTTIRLSNIDNDIKTYFRKLLLNTVKLVLLFMLVKMNSKS